MNQSQPFDDDDWDEDDEELMENDDELDEEDEDVENMKLINDQDDILVPPTINWQELSPLGKSEQRERQPSTSNRSERSLPPREAMETRFHIHH